MRGRPKMTKRKRYALEFKAKVALAAIREELTTVELAKKYDIHPTMITGWKKTAIENMASVFDAKMTAQPLISEGEVEKLHAKIGQLAVERDFLADASSLGHQRRRSWQTRHHHEPGHVSALPGRQGEPPIQGGSPKQAVGFRLYQCAHMVRNGLSCLRDRHLCKADRRLANLDIHDDTVCARRAGAGYLAKKNAR